MQPVDGHIGLMPWNLIDPMLVGVTEPLYELGIGVGFVERLHSGFEHGWDVCRLDGSVPGVGDRGHSR
jgi:hypothetical protein